MPFVDYKVYSCIHCDGDADAIGESTDTNNWYCDECGHLTRGEVRVADDPPPLQDFIDWDTPVTDRLPRNDGPLDKADILCRWNGKHLNVYGILDIDGYHLDTIEKDSIWFQNHYDDSEHLAKLRRDILSTPVHLDEITLNGFHVEGMDGERTDGDARQWGTAVLPRPDPVAIPMAVGGRINIWRHTFETQNATDGGGDSQAP